MASFSLLPFSLKHHGSSPSPASSAMQCLLWRPLPSGAFQALGWLATLYPSVLQALAFLQPMIALAHSSQRKPPASRQSQSPFPMHSFPQSHSSYPRPCPLVRQSCLGSLPSSLRPAVLPRVPTLVRRPALGRSDPQHPSALWRVSASAEQSHCTRIFYPLPSAKPRTFQKAGAQKHVLYWTELNQSLQEHFDKSNYRELLFQTITLITGNFLYFFFIWISGRILLLVLI